MEYRDIEYAVRARLGRDQWVWTIYPKDARASTNQFIGTRDGAIAAACRRIDRLLAESRLQDARSLK
jgi:hypothetical protein